MTAFLMQNIAPLMFGTLVIALLIGYPVAFSLAAVGIGYAVLGIYLGLFELNFLQALPERLWGVMSNDTLLCVPFFTFMGLILERSGMAEDLLDTIGQVFGPVRGGLAYAVIFVGALLAATTPVVAASIAPTRMTAYARPPRIGPNSWPMVSSRSSAIPDRSRISPISVKNGTASRVSFCMMPKMRSGSACSRAGGMRPISTPTTPKKRPQAPSEKATG